MIHSVGLQAHCRLCLCHPYTLHALPACPAPPCLMHSLVTTSPCHATTCPACLCMPSHLPAAPSSTLPAFTCLPTCLLLPTYAFTCLPPATPHTHVFTLLRYTLPSAPPCLTRWQVPLALCTCTLSPPTVAWGSVQEVGLNIWRPRRERRPTTEVWPPHTEGMGEPLRERRALKEEEEGLRGKGIPTFLRKNLCRRRRCSLEEEPASSSHEDDLSAFSPVGEMLI